MAAPIFGSQLTYPTQRLIQFDDFWYLRIGLLMQPMCTYSTLWHPRETQPHADDSPRTVSMGALFLWEGCWGYYPLLTLSLCSSVFYQITSYVVELKQQVQTTRLIYSRMLPKLSHCFLLIFTSSFIPANLGNLDNSAIHAAYFKCLLAF